MAVWRSSFSLSLPSSPSLSPPLPPSPSLHLSYPNCPVSFAPLPLFLPAHSSYFHSVFILFLLSIPHSLPPSSLVFLSFILSLSSSSLQHANWMCPSCVQAVKAEEDRHKSSSSSSSSSLSVQQSSKEVQTPSTNPGGCNCAACVAKRWEEHYCWILNLGRGGGGGGRMEGLICEPRKPRKLLES